MAGLGDNAELALRVLHDDLTPPPAGQAKLRVINVAPSNPVLDVRLANGATVATGVPYAGTSEYGRCRSARGRWSSVEIRLDATGTSATPAGPVAAGYGGAAGGGAGLPLGAGLITALGLLGAGAAAGHIARRRRA